MCRYIAVDLETNGLLFSEITQIHMVIITDLETGETMGYTDEAHKLTRKQAAHVVGSVYEGLAVVAEAEMFVTFNGWNFDLIVIETLFPEWRYHGLHIDLRTHGNTIIPHDRLYSIDKKLAAQGKLPTKLVGSESLRAWAIRAGGELKAEYDGPWDEMNPEMWDYGLQDGATTASVYNAMMRKKYRVPWATMWIEQEVARLIGRAQRNGWRFNEEKALALDAKLARELGDARRAMEDAFGAWYRRDKGKCESTLVQGPLGGFKVFDTLPTRFLTMKGYRIWDVQTRKRTTQGRKRDPKQGLVSYEAGAPYTPVEHHHFNASSRMDVYTALHVRYGWEPKQRTKGGGPAVSDDTLSPLDWPEAQAAARYYKLEKLAGYVASWRKAARRGRIYGTIHHNRANTRRMSHASPNLAQVPTKGDYGHLCRELFEADEGWVSIGADAEGLELRTLAHRLAMFDEGTFAEEILTGDPHIAFAAAATELPREVITDDIRSAGKTLTYAYMYGAGDAKLAKTYLGLGVGKRPGKDVRINYEQNIHGLFELVEYLRTQLDTKGYIGSLDGWKLWSRARHSVLNLQLQSDGALVMKAALIFADERLAAQGLREGTDWKLSMLIHDEFQGTAPEKLKEIVGAAFVGGMNDAGRFFNMAIPIDGKAKYGLSWADTH